MPHRVLLLLPLAGLLTSSAPGDVSAAELPVPPPGWTIEVVAEAPVVNHPTVVCAAADGRVFVAEDPMDISAPADAALGRVLCFAPDGTRTVFASGLHAVFGMQFLEGSLYVLHNPYYSRFDAAGVTAGERVDLIRSTNPKPWALDWNDHIPANFRLAMDGRFYVSVGDKGVYGAVGADGSTLELFGGGVFRMRPDAEELEVISTGTRNHLDVAINADDEVFTYDNTDEIDWMSRVAHMVEGGYYGYPFDHKPLQPFALPPLADYGAGAATSILSYDDDALPPEYRGDLFLCDWGRREIFRLQLERSGGTYVLSRRIDFLVNTPPDFRPVGMAFGADGRTLFIADWRHPDTKAQVDAGRLLKATYTGPSAPAPLPGWYVAAATGKPFDAGDDEVVAALRHPSRSVRLTAQRVAARRGGAMLGKLAGLLADAAAPALARSHALWALDGIAPVEAEAAIEERLREPLGGAHATVRAQAIRRAGLRRDREAITLVQSALESPDGFLRRHAACALGRIGDPAAAVALIRALADDDLFVRQAIWTALHRIGRAHPETWPLVAQGLSSADARVRDGVLHAFRDAHDLAAVQALSRAAAGAEMPLGSRQGALAGLGTLARKLPRWRGEWWAYHPAKLERPVRTEAWEGTSTALAALQDGLRSAETQVRRAAVGAVRVLRDRSLLPPLRELLQTERDEETVCGLLAAVASFNDAESAGIVAAKLREATAADAVLESATAAAESLGGAVLVQALEERLRSPALNAASKVRAAGALGRLASPSSAAVLLALLDDPRVDVRRAAVSALGSLKAPAVFDELWAAYQSAGDDVKLDLAIALAATPDSRAIEAYLFGLSQPGVMIRQRFHKAMASLRASAAPLVEARLAAGTLDRWAALELRRIWADDRPVTEWRVLAPRPRVDPLPVEAFNRAPPDWLPVAAGGGGIVDLNRTLAPGSQTVAFLYAEVHAAAVAHVDFMVSAGGKLELYVNGARVHQSPGGLEVGEKVDRVASRLHPGTNRILVRLEEAGGGAGFFVKAPAMTPPGLYAVDLGVPDARAYLDFVLKNPGDARRGSELFRDAARAACLKCHAIGGAGGKVGPELAGVGTQYDRKALAESLLFPSQGMRPGYEPVTLATTRGEVRTGILRADTAQAVTIVDAEGVEHVIPVDEIAAREKASVSIMPEGLAAGLSPEEVADLVAYLESLKGK